ncbi:chromate efflux transporter [Verrucomicrobiaceae bacterium N1E253]|uniref:Chromate efflux transporter n=2 Tax=Oceaniferula marina TaxID=2748318 RepID=A0A851GPJ8_9BACT|nr:chromate efflux transporter [Oceaniferula marina]
MQRGALECFWTSLKLGLTSFGGPVAHLGYFHEVYVKREKWLSDERYAELVSLTQFLPGPGSSQLGAAIGYERAGWLGSLGSWLGFTLPSALLMIGFAIGMSSVQEWLGLGWLHGLKIAAIAVVVVALFGMQQKLCTGKKEAVFAIGALLVLMFTKQAWVQPVVILIGGLVGAFVFHDRAAKECGESLEKRSFKARWWHSVVPATLLMVVLMAVPAMFPESRDAMALGGLMHAGALVFGGGHVVLPLLETSTVDAGLMPKYEFLAGYGAAQAVPGPMFTFCAFLGAVMGLFGNPWLGGLAGLVAVFLPGMVLLGGGLPVWDRMKHFSWARAGVRGANATVVGVLGAALAAMFFGGSVSSIWDVLAIVLLVLALHFRWLPVWALVVLAAVIGAFGL